VLFSEWTTMLGLIERRINVFSWLCSPGRIRAPEEAATIGTAISARFEMPSVHDHERGRTGLNLQAANTVINVDLPWNPAILEQRIARAHRMGRRTRFMSITGDGGDHRGEVAGHPVGKARPCACGTRYGIEVREVALSSGMEELKAAARGAARCAADARGRVGKADETHLRPIDWRAARAWRKPVPLLTQLSRCSKR